MAKRKELGKGIRALLSNIEDKNSPEQRTEVVQELSRNTGMIRTSEIEVNPFQPRTEFDPKELEELAQSLRTYGLIQPITVRRLNDSQYQLISGERRLRASKLAGLAEIPAYVRIVNDQELLEMALVENIQRSNLNAIEVGISYQRLIDECQLTHETMAERVGKDRSTITNYIRLLKLPPPIQNALKTSSISMGHARALAGISEIDRQLYVFNELISKGLSVRALEQFIKSYNSPKSAKSKSSDDQTFKAELTKMSDTLSHKYNTKVSIVRNADGKGVITFNFLNDNELNDLFESME